MTATAAALPPLAPAPALASPAAALAPALAPALPSPPAFAFALPAGGAPPPPAKYTAGFPGCACDAASWCSLPSLGCSASTMSTSMPSLSFKYSTLSLNNANSSKGTVASKQPTPNAAASSRLKAANGPNCLPKGFNEASCIKSCMHSFHCALASSLSFISSIVMSGNAFLAFFARKMSRTLTFHSGNCSATYTVADEGLPFFDAFSNNLMKSCGTLSNMYTPCVEVSASVGAVGSGHRAARTEPGLFIKPQPCSQKCGAMGEKMIICHSKYRMANFRLIFLLPALQTSRYWSKAAENSK
mmetsp:Transcript_60819/g.168288  ORF Transcript_60819/g.168288 Transcript_60819/m.168288 type:complete len:300 (-) Transcript_60819:204-1103(-)